VGGFISPVGGVSILTLAQAVDDPSSLTSVPTGTTIGIGRFKDTGVNFAAILRALRSDTNTNIISTPNIVTMDNQEAQIKVAQEVPFVTGSFTNTGGTGGSVNPFQTIQRQEVGTILKVTPQINEGDSVLLKIEQEASSIAQTSGAGDLTAITNKRTISTTVLIEDGGIIALGGLMQDDVTEGNSRVPFLGKIPILGHLFKTTNAKKVKTNLMVFIRTRILRDDVQTAIMTDSKYEDLRRQQENIDKGHVPLLPFQKQPVLPPLDEIRKPIPKTSPPETSTDKSAPAPAAPQPGATEPTPPVAEQPPVTEEPAQPTRDELLRKTRPADPGNGPTSQ
jgi:general secretion pathway protein D